MLYGRYDFASSLEEEAILPAYKGSTFRGVFGLALKKVVCALRRQECPECLLRERCIYSIVFETASNQGKPSPPHPFVIEPPLSEDTLYPRGSEFDFTFILFGWANDYLPYFVYAIEEMGRIGIGRMIDGVRPGLRLVRITSGEEVIYEGKERKLRAVPPVKLGLDAAVPSDAGMHAVTLRLETPLRLKHQNHLQADLPFHVLVRAMLRRIASLGNYYGEGEPSLDYRGLVARAEAVRITRSALHWVDWRRYSNRQEQAMLMGGLMGEVTYEGALGEFVPLLRYNEKVHLGKATTFGLGKIAIGPVSPGSFP